MFKKEISKKIEYTFLTSILIIVTIVYLNHFDNPFFFDDSHTISSNSSIKTLKNWTSFFTNADTFSSLPSNRAYIHIFFWFLFLIILINLLSKKLYQKSEPKNKWITLSSLFGSSWFALHTANAETINYICARSDSFSTLAIVASILLYIHPHSTNLYHLI